MFPAERLVIHAHEGLPPGSQPVEVVERKGPGHPDTLCDAIAERTCVQLCRYYRSQFGTILHHNVDKVLLCGGAARSAFGGGHILEPIELYLAGRATQSWRGENIPVDRIALDACRAVLRERLPELNLEREVRITSRIRPGSSDLTGLFARTGAVALANDTSCGAGFAPLTDLERVVLEVDRVLGDPATKRAHPALGSDTKVMGVRRDRVVSLTVGCAFIGRHLPTLEAYRREKEAVRQRLLEAARRATSCEVEVELNAADDLASGEVFLTVSGTSAEAGDDGEVGRGNRVGGLITPYRPMTMEAAAGKNPVSHVGKLYNVLAGRLAASLVHEVRDVRGASCLLVSQIGRPVDSPQTVDVQLVLARGVSLQDVRAQVEHEVARCLGALPELLEELLEERIVLY